MRDVGTGEELTIDYAMFDDYDGTMTCTCGSTECRSVIDGRDWRRRDLQTRYPAGSRGTSSARSTSFIKRRLGSLLGTARVETACVPQEGPHPARDAVDA